MQATIERNKYKYKTGFIIFRISLVEVVCTSSDNVTVKPVKILKKRFTVSGGLYDQKTLNKHPSKNILRNFSFFIIAIASRRLSKREIRESKNINGYTI